MKRPAFTLIEILVAAVIFLVAIVISVGAFSATIGSQSRVEDVQIVTSTHRKILDEVTQQTRQATGVVSRTNPDLVIPGFAVVDQNGNPVTDSSDGVTDGIAEGSALYVAVSADETKNYIYYLSNNILKRKNASDPANEIYVTPIDVRVEKFRLVGSKLPPGPVVNGKITGLDWQPFIEIQLVISPQKTTRQRSLVTTTIRATVTAGQYGIAD